MTHTPPKDEQPEITDDEVEASRAPLLEHLTELRERLIRALVALSIGTIASFFFGIRSPFTNTPFVEPKSATS